VIYIRKDFKKNFTGLHCFKKNVHIFAPEFNKVKDTDRNFMTGLLKYNDTAGISGIRKTGMSANVLREREREREK
jgi:hypothetical protein